MNRLFWPVLLAVGALLLFSGLSRRDLWQDEAETALLARSITRTGLPVASDGLNVVSGEVGRDFGPGGLWRWHPWLQFYLAAGSFEIFGEGSAAARLPFALLGLACLPLCWWWVRRLFDDERLARMSAALLALDVPFLLHMRQARWYAPACAASLGALGFSSTLLFGKTPSRRDAAGLALCGAALFYSNYLVAAAFAGALIGGVLWVRPERERIRSLRLGLAGAALLCVPGALLHLGMARQEAAYFGVLKTALQAGGYAAWALLWVCPLPLLALAAWRSRGRKQGGFLLVFAAAFIAFVALGPWRYFRYLAPLFPVGAALSALAISGLWERRRAAAVAAGAALILTDVLSAPFLAFLPKRLQSYDRFVVLAGVGSPLLGLGYELTHDFDSCDRETAAYLRAHAAPGDVVIATYGDLVLQFYTRGLKILGGFQGLKLPSDPDWIVAQPSILSTEPGKDADVFRFLGSRVDLTAYEPAPLVCQSAMLASCTEPWAHEFRPSDKPPLKLLKRVRPRLSRP